MDEFFGVNPGMSSRIAHHLDFAAYTLDELVTIGQVMLTDASYYLSDQAEAAFREQLSVRMREPRFANARTVRNDLERARVRARPPAGLEHGAEPEHGRADAPGVRGHPVYRRSWVTNLYRSPRYHDCAHSTGSPVTSNACRDSSSRPGSTER